MPSTRAMVESIGISLQITDLDDLAGTSPTGTRVSMKAWLDPSALALPRTSKSSKTREYVLCWSVRFLTVHLILARGSPDPASSSLPTWLSTSWARGAGPMAAGQPTLCEYNKGIEETLEATVTRRSADVGGGPASGPGSARMAKECSVPGAMAACRPDSDLRGWILDTQRAPGGSDRS